MGLDRSGVWRPLCDLSKCKDDIADDGVIEVDVLVAGSIETARVHVCARHLAACTAPARLSVSQ